ncbi:sulfatase-like hydrolase/transferase [Arthrobacter pigmenti]
MTRPNILVICSDEHHPVMSGYRRHPYVKTPNLDALAEGGTYFTNAYCNSPVCVPSRMSFMTGKYAHEVGSWFLYIPLERSETTWSRRLREGGVTATMLGKLDMCGDYQDAGFSHHQILEYRPAWTEYPRQTPFAPRLEGYVRPDKLAHIKNSGIRQPHLTDGRTGHDDRDGFWDHDRIVTDWAVDYLREKGKVGDEEPWALYVGLLYPHWPYCVPEEYFDQYFPDKVEMPFDASFPNENLHPALRHFQRAQGTDGIRDEDVRRTVAAYYGMITAMDAMIGRIIDELKAEGLYDNTYIIYTSDHGESLGEHGLFYKQCSYEGSVGIPLIVKGPDLPAGQVRDNPVSLVDLYPTVLDMAGLDVEPDRRGTSWLPLIRDEATARPEWVFAEHHGNFFKDSWYMIRLRDYKYTYYCHERPTLYNVHHDPHEMQDLAGDARYAPVLAECEMVLRSVLDPEAVALRAKRDLGLIGPDGEDYTTFLTVEDLRKGRNEGRFKPEPQLR